MPDPEILPVQPPAPTPAPQPANEIFYGPNGIRAGWRVLIFLALVIVLFWMFTKYYAPAA